MVNFLVKSIYAGLVIGIGGTVYLSVENKVVGAFLFAFGLLTIIVQKYNLFTGKVGYTKTKQDVLRLPVIILGNLIGTAAVALMMRVAKPELDLTALCAAKVAKPLPEVFLLSIGCGVLMYLAIDNYARAKNYLFVILPVMIFILSGFEHSIANMFYFTLGGAWDLHTIGYELVMILGNAAGAILFHSFDKKPEEQAQ